ncbi:cation-translocating P-type ATPase [Desulfovibrio litoralis]|nr:cation-translocating P-type ATPase [Desulfovibrio litoralis]
MTNNRVDFKGLTAIEAQKLQEQYGKNELSIEKRTSFFKKILHILSEPMFLLLIVAASIYFILGEPTDGIIMLLSVVGIISIAIIQEWKTDKTLNALKELSAPHIIVIRDATEITIASTDLVPGDIMIIHEGVKIPADGFIIKCNDLCVDESSLTGESEGVWKTTISPEPEQSKILLDKKTQATFSNNSIANNAHANDYWRKDYCYAGTLVSQGTAFVQVDKIGVSTEYGKIGTEVGNAPDEPTPLQKQIGGLVKFSAIIAFVLFFLVSIVTWFNLEESILKYRLIDSILSGITIAIAMIPEEFPVVLTVFLSMGAWRLAKKQSLIRQLPAVETLGAISVLCVDKTGTITLNQMTVQTTWAMNNNDQELAEIMGLGCEVDTYDPMEKAMLAYCEKLGISTSQLFTGELIFEYAFTNSLKMMGHVWRRDNEILIAAKGSPERILTICQLTEKERQNVESQLLKMSEQGLRVIAVATTKLKNETEIPPSITDCTLTFCGLIGLVDPPRETIKNDIALCNKAGIRIIMITGDNGITASTIAKKIGMLNSQNIITGDMLEQMTDVELREKVKTINIFSRVIPEHKMRIVRALKDNNEIVAMTGDGVNDAPALKYADIGIAMGKRGSEVAREAADIILMDDNFSTIVDTIKDGRRIYDNIQKAVGYIFTIHIPIAAAALFAPLLGIMPSYVLFLPLHIVIMEFIIDPTCSIVLERQPAEANIMDRKPRNFNDKLLNLKTLLKSVIQGAVIFIASFGTYLYVLSQEPKDAPLARTMGISIIILANLFLVQVNSSNYDSIFVSIKRLIKDKVMWAVNVLTLCALLVFLYTPLHKALGFSALSITQVLFAFGIAAVSVLWYEIVKWAKRLA